MRLLHGLMLRSLVMAAALLVLLVGEGRAQQGEVGRVERIAEQKGKFVETTPRAELWRTGGDLRLPVTQAAPLRYQDIVRLRERIFLDLRFEQPNLETNVYLGSQQLSEAGSYEILEDTSVAVGGLELVVRQGVMVIEHARGELMAVAAGIRTRIFGTTVLFDMESETQGTVYLSEGHIGFPTYGMDEQGQGRAWRLQSGQAPVEITLAGPLRQRYQQEVQYNTAEVWQKTPFWQKPSFYIPAAAAVLGGGVLLITNGGGDEGTASGRVTILLPE